MWRHSFEKYSSDELNEKLHEVIIETLRLFVFLEGSMLASLLQQWRSSVAEYWDW